MLAMTGQPHLYYKWKGGTLWGGMPLTGCLERHMPQPSDFAARPMYVKYVGTQRGA